MKRVRFLGNGKIEIEEVDLPRPGEGEVLVRIRMSAICGSEMHAYRSEKGIDGNAGHEAVGEIADACGQPGLQDGQRVAIHVVTTCGRCYWCLRGRDVYCFNRRGLGSLHAEYAAVPAHHCLPIPDDITWEQALMVGGDTMGVAYHASTRAGVRAGDFAAVFGAGPIGLGFVRLLSFWGLRVASIEPNEYRRGLAGELGAELTIDPTSTDPVQAVREWSGEQAGADFAFDCTGSPQALVQAIQCVRKGGTVGVVGERPHAEINPSEHLIRNEITVFGSWYFLRSEFPHMVQLVRRGLQPERLITHVLPLERAAEGYELMASGQSGKVVLSQL